MKFFKFSISMAMVILMLFASVCPANAADIENKYEDYIISSTDYPNGIFAVSTVLTHDAIVHEIPGTRANHVEGASLTISVNTSYSLTEEATAGFGCSGSLSSGTTVGISEFAVATANMSFTSTITTEVGLTLAETCSINSGVSYTLGSNKPTGIYCISMVFPGKTVTKELVGINIFGRKITLWDETIEYGPQLNQSYYTLWPED